MRDPMMVAYEQQKRRQREHNQQGQSSLGHQFNQGQGQGQGSQSRPSFTRVGSAGETSVIGGQESTKGEGQAKRPEQQEAEDSYWPALRHGRQSDEQRQEQQKQSQQQQPAQRPAQQQARPSKAQQNGSVSASTQSSLLQRPPVQDAGPSMTPRPPQQQPAGPAAVARPPTADLTSPRSPVRPPPHLSAQTDRQYQQQPQSHQQQPQQHPQQQREPILRVRVLSLERRGKNLCVRFDAGTNLPSFRFSQYPPFLRTYHDLTVFALSLAVHVPSHILSALPLPPSGLDTSPAETRLLCHSLSRWFARLTSEPAHRDHPETRNFVESEYSYHPLPPNPEYTPPLVQRRWRAVMDHASQLERGVSLDLGGGLGLPTGVLSTPATPAASRSGGLFGFGGGAKSASGTSTMPGGKGLSLSRNVHDEDEDLVAARMEVTRLELQFNEAAIKVGKVIEARSGVTQQLASMSNNMHTLAGVEDTRQLSSELGLPRELRRLADGIVAIDMAQQATSHVETITLLYQLAYQSSNARSAKEALLARNALVEEHHDASKRALLKKREVESLKARMGSAGVNRDRIEIAIDEFGEASRYANALRGQLAGLSKTMHGSLQTHAKNAHRDLQAVLVEHAKGSVWHLKREIGALKGLREELRLGEELPQPPQPPSSVDMNAVGETGGVQTEQQDVGAGSPVYAETTVEQIASASEPVPAPESGSPTPGTTSMAPSASIDSPHSQGRAQVSIAPTSPPGAQYQPQQKQQQQQQYGEPSTPPRIPVSSADSPSGSIPFNRAKGGSPASAGAGAIRGGTATTGSATGTGSETGTETGTGTRGLPSSGGFGFGGSGTLGRSRISASDAAKSLSGRF